MAVSAQSRVLVPIRLQHSPTRLLGLPGLILIHRFPPSLLFHSHRSIPVPIRGYHKQTLFTLLWLPYTCLLYTSPSPRD